MFSKQSITFLMATTLLVVTSARSFSDENARIKLFSLMARSNDLIQRNPSRSSECFNYYIPLIDEIAKTYQQNHDICLQASKDGRAEAEAATLEKRNALGASASSACELLSPCAEIEAAEEVFECYAAGGAENAKTMYLINVNAAEHLSDLKEEFRLVENREYKCTNETKRQYEKDSSKAYEDFNKCILGIIDVPKPTEPPTEVPTESPESTASPEESTQAPTETPESTASPEETESTNQPTEAPVSPTETTQAPDEPESTEDPEESDEFKVEEKLPEEDLS